MRKFFKNHFKSDSGAWLKFTAVVVLGAGLGYLYYRFWGCNGTCPLTENANITVALGTLFGANLSIDFILKKKKKSSE
ncbi:MAG TPA: hypothetical protein ENH29_05045 [Bacteroidetes bacterium]|nr:hypothetical protein [Bacteroidota bacterium]